MLAEKKVLCPTSYQWMARTPLQRSSGTLTNGNYWTKSKDVKLQHFTCSLATLFMHKELTLSLIKVRSKHLHKDNASKWNSYQLIHCNFSTKAYCQVTSTYWPPVYWKWCHSHFLLHILLDTLRDADMTVIISVPAQSCNHLQRHLQNQVENKPWESICKSLTNDYLC